LNNKQLWILAGGNGAGKSTFYRTQLEFLGLAFINAYVLAKELYPQSPEEHSYEAAKLATEMHFRLLQEGRRFCFEAVFSHPSKIDFVAQAKALGKVAARIPRLLVNIKKTLLLCDRVYILDNSSFDKPLQQVAAIQNGKIQTKMSLPSWDSDLLGDYQ